MKSSDTGNIAELIEMLRQDAVENTRKSMDGFQQQKDSQINGSS